VLSDLVDAWLYGEGLAELNEFEARVRGVSASEMLAVARWYFDPERRVEGIVRWQGQRPATAERGAASFA
jgi:zinc protease